VGISVSFSIRVLTLTIYSYCYCLKSHISILVSSCITTLSIKIMTGLNEHHILQPDKVSTVINFELIYVVAKLWDDKNVRYK